MTNQHAPRRSLVAQTLLTLCGNTAGLAASVVAGVVVARTLGPAGKGLLAYAALVLGIVVTFANGIQQAVLHQRGHRRENARAVYAAALRTAALGGVPVTVGLAALGWAFPHLPYVYASVAVPFAAFVQIALGFFFLADDIPATVVVNAIQTVGFAVVTIPLLLIAHVGLPVILAVWSATYLLAASYAWWHLGRYLPRTPVHAPRALVADQARFALKVGSINLADFLNLRIDVLIVGAMLGARDLGVYSLAVATGELMWQLSRPLAWAAIGRLAALPRADAAALAARVTRTILCLEAVVGIVVFVCAPFAVQLVYGRAFAESGSLVRWLLPGLVLYAAHGALGSFIIVKEGRPAAVFAVQAAAVAACAALTAATVGRYGLVGAAIATVVTYAFSAFAKAVLFVRATGIAPSALVVPDANDVERFRRLLDSMVRRLTTAVARLGGRRASGARSSESTS